jgi:hypothetical protein
MAGPIKDKLIKFAPSPLDLLPKRPLIERGVGALVMQLSFVHFLLEINLWSLLGIDQKSGRILTEDLPLASLSQRFLRTVEANNPGPDALKQLKNALKELEKINCRRNRIVHGFWTFPEDGPPEIVPKKGEVISQNAPTYKEIEQLIHATEQFIIDFFKCMNRIANPGLDELKHSHARKTP